MMLDELEVMLAHLRFWFQFLTGMAQVSLSVDLTFFHTSVSFSVSETFGGWSSSSDEILMHGPATAQLHGTSPGAARNPFAPVPGFLTAVQSSDWTTYCGAFAS
jgi:hypothetical protein